MYQPSYLQLHNITNNHISHFITWLVVLWPRFTLFHISFCLSYNFWSFERKTYTWWSPKSSYSWNPVDFRWNLLDFMQILCGFHLKSAGFHESSRCHVKSGGFHLKCTYKTYKSNISRKNSSVLWSAVGRLCHVFTWNPPDFMKSARFHVKSAGFRKTNCQEW